MSGPFSGSCVCGSITFQVPTVAQTTYVCFCSDCRKFSGNFGQYTAEYAISDLQISDVNKLMKDLVIEKTSSGKPKTAKYCGRCGSTVYSILNSVSDETAYLRHTLLDDGFDGFPEPQALFTEEKMRYTSDSSST